MQQAIAVFDSGVGGLTVVKEVMRQLPQEKIIYFGDTARAPYGPRPGSEVMAFTRQIVGYLIRFNPKLIVVACNTATAVVLEFLRESLEIPVIGVIHPGVRAAVKTTKNGTIGVIGTEGTIRSGAYKKALEEISPALKVYSMACPSFVPLVENGLYGTEEARKTVLDTLAPLRRLPLDTLILGCTHYPFLAEAIAEAVGPDVTLISSAEETAREISAILHHNGQLAKAGETPVHQFFCSGSPELFRHIAKSWLRAVLEENLSVWQTTRMV